MEKVPYWFLGIVVGLFFSLVTHELMNSCRKSNYIESSKKVVPSIIITNNNGVVDTLYIYKIK